MTALSLSILETILQVALPRDGTSVRVYITPQMASLLLSFNKNNRPVSPMRVKEIAKLLRSGQFFTTHQGIAFDKKDNLQDGQHRLMAIVESGVAAYIMVSGYQPETNFGVIDKGRARSVSDDLVTRHGVAPAVSNTIAAALKFLTAYERFLSGGAMYLISGKAGEVDDVRVFLQRREQLELSVDVGRSTQKHNANVVASIATAAHCLMSDLDRDMATSMFESVGVPVGLEPNSPIIALLNWLRTKGAHSKATETYKNRAASVRLMEFGAYIRTWNALRRGKPLSRFHVDPSRPGALV